MNHQLLDRMPPSDLDAELSVIGSILISPALLDELSGRLHSHDFYGDANQRLWRHILAMRKSGEPVDSTTLVSRLKTLGDFEVIGGGAYLGRCISSVPHAAHASYYANIVREKSVLRSLITTGTDMLRRAFAEDGDAVQQLASAERSLIELRMNRDPLSGARHIAEIAAEAVHRIRADAATLACPGVMTGLADLDEIQGAIHGGELFVLAARPGRGKTSFAIQWAQHVAKRRGNVLFVSLEMSGLELVKRALCGAAGISSTRVRSGQASLAEIDLLADALPVFDVPVHVVANRRMSIGHITAAARRLQTSGGLAMVVVDYIGRVQPDNIRCPRHEQVTQIVCDLKTLARELDVPVLALCQLKREDDATPTLSSLRESGDIEAEADYVGFLHTEVAKATKSKSGVTVPPNTAMDGEQIQFIVAKGRFSGTGRVSLRWYKAETRFESNRAF